MTEQVPAAMGRRAFLARSCALAMAPVGCADTSLATGELWASAQGNEAGSYELLVVGPGRVHARFASEVRGHGLAQHPNVPERVVMFGRRPTRVGLVVDVVAGETLGGFECPAGRHLAGHGCFNGDGSQLFVVEADDLSGQGAIAVLDADTLERLGEFDSHGVGPHEIALMPGASMLVVANGGLRTEPGGRDPINLDTMRSSLVYLDANSGALRGEHMVPESKASLRHLAVADDGTVAVVMQVQRAALDDEEPRPLIAVHSPGGTLRPLEDGVELGMAMQDYAGSVALDSTARVAAVTSPRGNLVAYWHLDTGASLGSLRFDDVSGVAVSADGSTFVLSGSGGQLRHADTVTLEELPQARERFADVRWDNHLLAVVT